MHNCLSPKALPSPCLGLLCLAQKAMAMLCLFLSQSWGSSAGLHAPDWAGLVFLSLGGSSLRRWLQCGKMKGEVLEFVYEPLYDCAAWQIPLAFKLWLVVTQADIAGSVMLRKILWKSWPRGKGRDPKQYPWPPERFQVSVLLAPWQGNPGALPARTQWPGNWQYGLGPNCISAFLHQWFGDAGLHIQRMGGAVSITRMWTLLWSDIEQPRLQEDVCGGLGGFFLSASS